MGIRDWDIVTSYVDSVTTTLKTVTFPKVQEQVKVKNQGNANLTYTIGSQSGTLTPGQSVTVSESISSFTIQATSGTQAFELRAKEKGTEQTEDNSTDVMAILANKAQQIDVTNAKIDTEKLVAAIATGESNNYAGLGYVNMNKNYALLSGDVNRNTGWFGSLSVKPSVTVQLPFGVVIGDSIAEGHPELHGRLHANGVNAYDPSVQNQSGQLSYEFGQMTGLYWYNHGIGGQVTAQIWGRWKRDVLGQVYSGYNDGLGSQTLPGKPYAVYINIGINDIAQGKDLENDTKVNMVNMAQSAKDNGILCIFNNVGAWSDATPTQLQQIKDLNTWMVSTLPKYGAYVADYYSWSEDPVQTGSGKVNTTYYADHIHPSRPGYKALARYLLNKLNGLPLYLRGLVVETPLDPNYTPSAYSRPNSVSLTLEGNTKNLTIDNKESAYIPLKSTGTDNVLTFKVNSGYTITGTNYTGIAKIKAFISSIPTDSSASSNDVSARVTNSSNQDIATASWTILTFDTERFDTSNIHDTTTNPSRLTCTSAGKYIISTNILFYPNATGIRALKFVLNGSTTIAQHFANNVGGTFGTQVTLTTIYPLVEGDYVEVQVYHNSGITMPVQPSPNSANDFMIAKISF